MVAERTGTSVWSHPAPAPREFGGKAVRPESGRSPIEDFGQEFRWRNFALPGVPLAEFRTEFHLLNAPRSPVPGFRAEAKEISDSARSPRTFEADTRLPNLYLTPYSLPKSGTIRTR
jgi:hypothetical protein